MKLKIKSSLIVICVLYIWSAFNFAYADSEEASGLKTYLWTLKLSTNKGQNLIRLEPSSVANDVDFISLQTRNQSLTTVSVSYDWLGASLSMDGGHDENTNDVDLETRSSFYALFFKYKNFTFEGFYSSQKGYYLGNPSDVDASWTEGSEYPIYDDMIVETMGVSIVYAFDPDGYSVSSVTGQTERILDGFSYSWLLGGNIQRVRANNLPTIEIPSSSGNIVTLELQDLEATSIEYLGGIGINLVGADFYFSPALMLGGALIISDKKTRPKFETNVASKVIVPFGYHDDDFFAGLSVISNITYFDDNDTSIGIERSSYDIFIGIHL